MWLAPGLRNKVVEASHKFMGPLLAEQNPDLASSTMVLYMRALEEWQILLEQLTLVFNFFSYNLRYIRMY